jgi:hypothetical protein
LARSLSLPNQALALIDPATGVLSEIGIFRQSAAINVCRPKQEVKNRTEQSALNYYDRREPYPTPLGVNAQNDDEYQ